MTNHRPSMSLQALVCRLATARPTAMVWLQRVLVLLACVAGLISLAFSAQSLARPYVYMKDFIQEYLFARAILAGVSPYLPIPDLAERFLGPLPRPVFPHPTPHPPAVGLMALPLGLLGYQAAAIVWFFFEIACICSAVYLLLRWLGAVTWIRVVIVTLCLLAWNPFWEELVFGQLMALLLVLLLLAWRALRANRPVQGGILLGLVVALKLIGWPIILFLGLRREYRRSAIAAATTAVVANGVAVPVMGWDSVVYYYTEVGKIVSSLYRGYAINFSLWSVGWRLFEGTGSPIISGATSAPMVAEPVLARCVSVLLPLTLLVVGLVLSHRAADLDTALAIMVCVSILANPVAWIHYLILSVIPLFVIGCRLARHQFPSVETTVTAITGLLLLVSHRQWQDLAILLGGQKAVSGDAVVAWWILNGLTLLPAALVIVQIWLLSRLDPGSAMDAPTSDVCPYGEEGVDSQPRLRAGPSSIVPNEDTNRC